LTGGTLKHDIALAPEIQMTPAKVPPAVIVLGGGVTTRVAPNNLVEVTLLPSTPKSAADSQPREKTKEKEP